ncbi:MAG: hypothetical protein O6945_07030 [Gammaproteobacteria bacterium]|nr:hypothetical protein [Gammaproteobacteria bacterium]
MATAKFNRTSQDVGNILAMEHVNVTVPDQLLATFFYVNGLGFTRDPYMDFGPFNVWINVGNQQFHLPTSEPQVLRGTIGVVVPSLDELDKRLTRVARRLEGTRFKFRVNRETIDVTCPWGNKIRCHSPGKFGHMTLGIPYVEFKVPQRTTTGIARFYRQVFDVSATARKGTCKVDIGQGQTLRFKESAKTVPGYDGHHIAIYVVNFSGPYGYLKKKGLITEESDENQYRFQKIVDPTSGKPLFEIEHEVRSLHHPMYKRNLVNRNATQSFFGYQHGRDAFRP